MNKLVYWLSLLFTSFFLFSCGSNNSEPKKEKKEEHKVTPPTPYPVKGKKQDIKGTKWRYVWVENGNKSVNEISFTTEVGGVLLQEYYLEGEPDQSEAQSIQYRIEDNRQENLTILTITYQAGMTDDCVIDWLSNTLTLKGKAANEKDLIFNRIP